MDSITSIGGIFGISDFTYWTAIVYEHVPAFLFLLFIIIIAMLLVLLQFKNNDQLSKRQIEEITKVIREKQVEDQAKNMAFFNETIRKVDEIFWFLIDIDRDQKESLAKQKHILTGIMIGLKRINPELGNKFHEAFS